MKSIEVILEESFLDVLARKLKRFKQQANKALWWDGLDNPKEISNRVSKSTDDELLSLIKFAEPRPKEFNHPTQQLQLKLANRELKKRYSISLGK